jgi:3-phenylpropionate/trans-cinnamate dioxygenase ferredoxin subunit
VSAPVRVATLAELADGKPIRVEVGHVPICLVRDGESLHALHDVCSHADVNLSDGDVEDGAVECWLHGSRFDLATGRPSGLPATRPVPVYDVTTDGEAVFVAVPIN